MAKAGPIQNDPAQAMLERMALIQIEETIRRKAEYEIAKSMAAHVPGRTAVGVTRFLARSSASHYTIAFVDPRWNWRVRPNVNMLAAIGKGVAEAVATMEREAIATRAAAEEKAATRPTLQ